MSANVLYLDPIATNRVLQRVRLGTAGYRPMIAADMAGLVALANAEAPDIVVIDLASLGDSPAAGVMQLRRLPRLARAPIIVLASRSAGEARAAVLEAGADDVLDKPVRNLVLQARIRSLLAMRRMLEELGGASEAIAALGLAEAPKPYQGPGMVAVIGERAEAVADFCLDMGAPARGGHRFVAVSAAVAPDWRAADGAMPECYVIDIRGGSTSAGMRLMAELMSRGAARPASVLVLCEEEDEARAAEFIDRGVDGVILRGQGPREILARIDRALARRRIAEEMRQRVRDGLRLAAVDPLTGLWNRRSGLARAEQLLSQAEAAGQPFGLIVLDIDCFKSVNDRHGHLIGDQVLVDVGQRLRAGVRAEDLVIRFGGEEFLIACGGISAAQLDEMAERLRESVARLPVELRCRSRVGVTISAGTALVAPGRMSADLGEGADLLLPLIARADAALLRAKANGRNRVERAGQGGAGPDGVAAPAGMADPMGARAPASRRLA